MIIVGVTGGSGSGKTTVSQALGAIAGSSIDADALYHELLESSSDMRKEILERFPQASDKEGKIDRKNLAKEVFSDATALNDLNVITHAYVLKEIEARVRSCEGQDMTIIDAPTLFQSGADRLCDVIVGVIAPRELRIERIIKRDGLDEERAVARIDAQPPDDFYRKRCDYIVDTGCGIPAEEIATSLYKQIVEGMKL